MSGPQQPELSRSGRSAVTPNPPDHRTSSPTTGDRPPDAVPPENRPGHHPLVEQDKPDRPPPMPRSSRSATFGFAGDDPLLRAAALAAGVLPGRAHVEVDPDHVDIRFGPWHVRVDRSDVIGAHVTGPYHPLKVIGPPRLGLRDRDITFATSRHRGVCLELRRPVRGIDPLGLVRHPAITVTVDEPDRLADLLR